MEDIKNGILNQITFEIDKSGDFSSEEIEKIKNIIIINLKEYDIVSKKYEIVISDRTNAELWKRFFLTKKAENLSDKSLTYYKNCLELFSLYVRKSFLNVTTDDIRLYLAVEREKNQQKAVSVDNIRRILNSFFSFLNEEEFISINPVKKIKKVKGQKTEKYAFSQLELEKLRMACKNSMEKAILEVLISSAIRATEIANIKIRDIDFEKNEIKVVRKGNKEGVAFISTVAALAIKKYISERGNFNTPYLWVADGIMYKCYRNQVPGNKIDTEGLRRILKSIATRAAVENVHPHRFRRTFATMALKKGMDVEEIQQVLGHQNINTTMIYVNIDKSSVKEKYKNIVGG